LIGQRQSMTEKLEGDPDWFDAKAAGWWCWGACCWIGSGWCSGNGPWQVVEGEDGSRQLVHLGDAGRGVNRQLVHLGDAGRGVNRKRVHLLRGVGVHRENMANEGDGSEGLLAWFVALADRLKRVRVCCGDWSRVCGPTPTVKMGLTACFLDPPYSGEANRTDNLYSKDSNDVAHDVRRWAIEHGDDPRLRIALAGYAGEHVMPPSWDEIEWKARGGYGSQGDVNGNTNGRENSTRERLWFSPHCLKPHSAAKVRVKDLFDGCDLESEGATQ